MMLIKLGLIPGYQFWLSMCWDVRLCTIFYICWFADFCWFIIAELRFACIEGVACAVPGLLLIMTPGGLLAIYLIRLPISRRPPPTIWFLWKNPPWLSGIVVRSYWLGVGEVRFISTGCLSTMMMSLLDRTCPGLRVFCTELLPERPAVISLMFPSTDAPLMVFLRYKGGLFLSLMVSPVRSGESSDAKRYGWRPAAKVFLYWDCSFWK